MNLIKNFSFNSNIIFGIITLFILFYLAYLLFNWLSPKKVKVKSIENFSNTTYTKKYPRNLITNGDFAYKKKPDQYVSQSGSNTIVSIDTPLESNFALKQENTGSLTYYELQTYCDSNQEYIFLTWVSFRNDVKQLKEPVIDLSKLINVRVLLSNNTNQIPTVNYKILQTIKLKDEVDTWSLVSYRWKTPADTDNLQNIYLNYTDKLPTKYVYFTGLNLYRVLTDAENFIYNDDLNLYLDGYHFESTSKLWDDLSSFGNNFMFNVNPFVDTLNGYIDLSNNKLTGITSQQLFGESDSSFSFSLVMSLNKESSSSLSGLELSGEELNSGETEEVESFSNSVKTILTIPGNNNFCVKLNVDESSNKLSVVLPNKTVETTNSLILSNKTMITLEYGKGGKFRLYQDSVVLIDTMCDIFYYQNKDKILINPESNVLIDLYAVLNYQRTVPVEELKEIYNYFVSNKNKDFTTGINYLVGYDNDYYDIGTSTIGSYDKQDPYTQILNTLFTTKYTNQSDIYNNEPDSCLYQANELCSAFYDDIDEYQKCLKNAKNVIPACKTYCEDPKNSKSILCESDKCDEKDALDPTKDCPLAYKRLNNFMVYIKPNSYYANKYQFYGEKSYGPDRESAKEMYKRNFPSCKVPSVLEEGEGVNTISKCPYVIYESNPCYQSQCAGVNWDTSSYKDLKMSDKCKKSVSYYCQVNYDLDNMCACWKPENRNKQNCVEYRKFFEDPKDYCEASQFSIEDHPDYSKYIRKDNIPCFGCNIE